MANEKWKTLFHHGKLIIAGKVYRLNLKYLGKEKKRINAFHCCRICEPTRV